MLSTAGEALLLRAFSRTADEIYGPGLPTRSVQPTGGGAAGGNLHTLAVYVASQDDTLTTSPEFFERAQGYVEVLSVGGA